MLREIDNIALPGVSVLTHTEDIVHYGHRNFTIIYDTTVGKYNSFQGRSNYGEGSSGISIFLQSAYTSDISNNYFKERIYFFRIFIDNYATITSFKFVFLNSKYRLTPLSGRTYQDGGVTENIQSKLKLFESPVNIETDLGTTNYVPPDLGILTDGTNIVESIVVETDNTRYYGDKKTTITFNAAGRAAVQGISTGYKDFYMRIDSTLCLLMLTYGYCFDVLAMDYLLNGKIVHSYFEVEYTI